MTFEYRFNIVEKDRAILEKHVPELLRSLPGYAQDDGEAFHFSPSGDGGALEALRTVRIIPGGILATLQSKSPGSPDMNLMDHLFNALMTRGWHITLEEV